MGIGQRQVEEGVVAVPFHGPEAAGAHEQQPHERKGQGEDDQQRDAGDEERQDDREREHADG
jgi:hypothetical protein